MKKNPVLQYNPYYLKMFRKTNKWTAFLALSIFFSVIQSLPLQCQEVLTRIQTKLAALENDPVLQDGRVGFCLSSAKTGEVLIELNSQKGMTPASNMKLSTTAAALKYLGADYKFETRLEYDGSIKDGVLHGNLYITGSGDPTLGSHRFSDADWEKIASSWIEVLKSNKIKKINGNIIGDGTSFDNNPLPDGWVWSDIGNYYGAGTFGLNVFDNTYTITFKPGKVGSKAEILRIEPTLPIEFINEVTTAPAGTGDNAYIYGSPYTNIRQISGTIPAGKKEFTIKGSIPDPPGYCARSFGGFLKDAGIEFTGKADNILFVKEKKERRTKLTSYLSPPLKDIVYQTNMYSINLYAEALLKSIGNKVHQEGSVSAGLQAVNEYWGMNKVVGCIKSADGSGLAVTNIASPAFLANAMASISSETYFPDLLESLPVAGVSGTLWNVCKGTPSEKKLRAKSGTLKGVICYTGYVPDKSGNMMAFSFMVNNYSGITYTVMRKKMEEIMGLLAEL
ncbi:D-alanyl-D-alanine carboxypeptidase/D-alanyl-D-alanine-endopeptidase [Cytophagaceae bacterium ABcell3]|nr:D-alanyl-D-alanine carboxypeptidase/D-alanyl-D-alanine-endopeptidase [Cytophagaceae bacterium ABcell3]